jgi:hypothetical protein
VAGATLLLSTVHQNPKLCGMIPAGVRCGRHGCTAAAAARGSPSGKATAPVCVPADQQRSLCCAARYAKGFNPYKTSLGVPCDLAGQAPGVDGFTLARHRLQKAGVSSG